MVDHRRNGFGDSYAVVGGIPRLQAMSVAAALRNGDPRGGPDVGVAAARQQVLDAEMATGKPPLDWHVWLQSALGVEESLHGGMAGVVDTAFYASLRRFLAVTHAPAPVSATIDFMHGLAAWDTTRRLAQATHCLARRRTANCGSIPTCFAMVPSWRS